MAITQGPLLPAHILNSQVITHMGWIRKTTLPWSAIRHEAPYIAICVPFLSVHTNQNIHEQGVSYDSMDCLHGTKVGHGAQLDLLDLEKCIPGTCWPHEPYQDSFLLSIHLALGTSYARGILSESARSLGTLLRRSSTYKVVALSFHQIDYANNSFKALAGSEPIWVHALFCNYHC